MEVVIAHLANPRHSSTQLTCLIRSFASAAVWILVLTSAIHAESLTPAWVELGERGTVHARIVVGDPASCPSIEIDGKSKLMTLRAPVPEGFRPACEALVPTQAKTATVAGQSLSLPKQDSSRILVMGDTGCRIKGARVQDCNNPELWPFETVAKRAASEHPDLVIHVGDYLYREDACPPESRTKCSGTPSGDRWETWTADFFTPAAELLRAAPWAFARGNHEDCKRSWRGWFYYLDPRPWSAQSCADFTAPYEISRANPPIVIVDSSAASEDAMPEERVDAYSRQFRSIHVKHGWLVAHHPILGVRSGGDKSGPIPVSEGLQKAWIKASPMGVDAILGGHTHLFELLTFGNLPIQIVAGIGGTQLSAPIPTQFQGLAVGNFTVMSGQSRVEFGYALMSKTAQMWDLSLKNAAGQVLVDCAINGRQASCKSMPSESMRQASPGNPVGETARR
jgi:hypothetical protein